MSNALEDFWSRWSASLAEQAPAWGMRLLTAIVLFLILWALSGVLRRVIEGACTSRRIDADLSAMLGRAASLTLLAIALVTSLGTLGIDVSAVVAGLGLTGFAVGFALKDVISNALAGFLLLLYEPFDQGEKVKVASFEGEAVRTTLRYTLLRTATEDIYVPNSMLFSNPVVVTRLRTDKRAEEQAPMKEKD